MMMTTMMKVNSRRQQRRHLSQHIVRVMVGIGILYFLYRLVVLLSRIPPDFDSGSLLSSSSSSSLLSSSLGGPALYHVRSAAFPHPPPHSYYSREQHRDQHQDPIIMTTDPVYPLFFKDGLEKVCSSSTKDSPDSIPYDLNITSEDEKPLRSPHHVYKCLTLSPDGGSAVYTTLPSSSLAPLIANGDAIYFGRDMESHTWYNKWFHCRLMNRLLQLRNALLYCASCGKLIILPIAIALDPEGYGEFDCADFRHMKRPDQTTITTMTTSKKDGTKTQTPSSSLLKSKEQQQQQKNVSITSDSCSLVISRGRDWFRYKPPPDILSLLDYTNRRNAAYRSWWAWWGYGPGYFRCQACTKQDLLKTIAWTRSDDVFKSTEDPDWDYGQPPLDYYIQAIELSQAHHVTLLSKDGDRNTSTTLTNPIVTELPKYYKSRSSNSNSRNTLATYVTVNLGQPFYHVLQQLFCARVAIIGVSSMVQMLALSPNAEMVVLPQRKKLFLAVEYGPAELFFYNATKAQYSIWKHWDNSPKQRQEMITFHDGSTLKPLAQENLSAW